MSSSTDADPAALPYGDQFTVTAVIGPAIASNVLVIFTMGALAVQYFYYITGDLYRKDTLRTKLTLHAAVLFATTQSVLVWWEIVHYATTQARSLEVLLGTQTTVGWFDLTFTAFEAALVQTYLAHRATALMDRRSKFRYIYWVLVGMGVSAALAGSLMYLAGSVDNAHGQEGLEPYYDLTIGLWFWGSAFTDLLITATLVVTLRRKMSSFSGATDSMLARMSYLAVLAAAPTAFLSLLAAITSAIPFTGAAQNIAGAFWVPPGLYAMSMISNLNAKRSVREEHQKNVFVAHVPDTVLDDDGSHPVGLRAESGTASQASEKIALHERV